MGENVHFTEFKVKVLVAPAVTGLPPNIDEMLDHLKTGLKRDSHRGAGGLAVSLVLHAILLGAVLWGTQSIRSEVAARRSAEGGMDSESGMVVPGQDLMGKDLAGRDVGGPFHLALPVMTLPQSVLDATGTPPLMARLPDTLELGRPETIRLTLPRNPLSGDSTVTMEGAANGISRVRLSRARLAVVYGENVIVEPQSPPLQLTDPQRRTEWLWTITATEPGEQDIYLQLDAPAEVNGQGAVVTIQRVRAPISVSTSPLQKASSFFERHWTWVSLITMVALIQWGRSVMRKGDG